MHYTDRPYFLAGTAAPDWLSVAARGVRLRPRLVEPHCDDSASPTAEFAAGVMQHFTDDDRFHRLPAFLEVSGQLTVLFRELFQADDGFRPGFLGHIVTELLLDAALIAQDHGRLSAYYAAIDSLDPAFVQQCVNLMAKKSTQRLVAVLPMFTREAFLWDYLQDERLLFRLNQVMRRVKLQPLPPKTVAVLKTARSIVEARCHDLLISPAPPHPKDHPP